MRENAAVRTTAGEGVDRVVPAAPRDMTVRDAILAAAELNSGVPAPRSAGEDPGGSGGVGGPGDSGGSHTVNERGRHG